jgi:hypothetical protein
MSPTAQGVTNCSARSRGGPRRPRCVPHCVGELASGRFLRNRSRGRVIEITEAFAAITGHGKEGLPYGGRYPRVADNRSPTNISAALIATGSGATDSHHVPRRPSGVGGDQRQRRDRRRASTAEPTSARSATSPPPGSSAHRCGAAPATATGEANSVADVLAKLLQGAAAPSNCAAWWPSPGRRARPNRPSRWPESRPPPTGGTSIPTCRPPAEGA